MSSSLQPLVSLPSLHPPGRSRTRAAWSAFAVLFFFFFLFFFHSFLLRMSIRSAFWMLQPITGLTIKAEKMDVAWGKPIHGHHVTITAGKAPFATTLTLQDCSLELSSWWRLFFGDHLLISSLQATQGKGVVDLRTLGPHDTSFWKKIFFSLASSSSHNLELLPASVQLHDVSFLLLTEGERYTIDHLSCSLPNKLTGELAYESILIEAGTVHCRLAAGKAKALWDGKKLGLRQLQLAEEITLQNFTLVPHRDRMELGIIAEVFDGLLRADGSLRHTPEGTFIDSAALGQQLPLGRLSRFLGLQKNLAGTIREGRLTFRGFMLNPMEAEASLRILADNVRLERRGWASLSITAHLIGRKISLTDFQLKQHENRVIASGEITLPEEWHKIANSPFLLKLKANISDTSQLADLMGSPWSGLTGKLFADGEVRGAANRAEGYLNIQGITMTAYELPLNSLKLQLLFQGEKTNLTNLDLWSGADHLECSGIVENKWPHHYQGRASLQSSNLSEKLIPLLQQRKNNIPSFLNEFFSRSYLEKIKFQGGCLSASWKGDGEATQHNGSFNITLNNLLKNSHNLNSHAEGSYGPEWISFSSFSGNDDSKKFSGQATFSSQGIDLQKLSLIEDHTTTLSGDAFLPINATMISHRPFSLSQAFLQDLPLTIHLQCHHFTLAHELNIFPWNLFPAFFDGNLDANGVLENPSLHLSLTGRDSLAQKGAPKIKLDLFSEQGKGTIDFSLATSKNKPITLQGTLPLRFLIQKESAPLQEGEHWKLGPASAPLDLKLSIPILPLDEVAACYLSHFFHVEKSFLSGNLTCKGTLSQPEPAGELQLQAESIKIKENITPLYHLQGKFLFNKEKMELSDTFAWMGKEKVAMTGKTEWYHQKQDYHFSGKNLFFYQSRSISAIGDVDLSLQGEDYNGTLHGKVTLQNIAGAPRLFVTPFLIPPGIEITPPTLIKSNIPWPWTIDVAVNTSPEIVSQQSSSTPFGSINLRLTGDLFNPVPEGTIALENLPIIFPQTSMKLLEGTCSFDASTPWQPTFQLTSSGILDRQRVIATFLKNHSLQLQSEPVASPTTLALELALPTEPSAEDIETWISQLPYWLREQLLIEPTTLFERMPANTEHEISKNLGFAGCDIAYHAEMR